MRDFVNNENTVRRDKSDRAREYISPLNGKIVNRSLFKELGPIICLFFSVRFWYLRILHVFRCQFRAGKGALADALHLTLVLESKRGEIPTPHESVVSYESNALGNSYFLESTHIETVVPYCL